MTITLILIFTFELLKAPSFTVGYIPIYPQRVDPLLIAFYYVESTFDTDTINRLGYAGILQEGPEMIAEANRLCELKGIPYRFTYPASAVDSVQATQIWYIVNSHHNEFYDYSRAVKLWNPLAGPRHKEKIEEALEGALIYSLMKELF